jgi:hypothetical protein
LILVSAQWSARDDPDTKMNALYLNHLTNLHNRLADLRNWAPCTRRDVLIEECELEIAEYTEMCAAEFDAAQQDDTVVTCELEEAVAWARDEAVVTVQDARKIAAQMETLAPGCSCEHGNLTVWSAHVELEDGARGEVRLVVTRGYKSGALRWIGM